MNVSVPDKLLKNIHLRSTPNRLAILCLLLNKGYALSYSDIENEIPENIDRVTVYRTLKTFLDKGLIHKVPDEGGFKYALCDDHCSLTEHHHDHVHFKCIACGQTLCLNVAVPTIKLPKGYKADEINLLVQGMCEWCAGVKP